jgi:hypothetical protein
LGDKDRLAKLRFIGAFFQDLEKKADYVMELYAAEHRDEAHILCSYYIQWLASALYWPEERKDFNYVRVLKKYGGKGVFSSIHPKMLDSALRRMKAQGPEWAAIYSKVSPELQKIAERLYDEQEIVALLETLLEHPELDDVKNELWRGTVAAIVYDRFQISSIHGFRPPDGTTFDNTTYQDESAPVIDVFVLRGCLKAIIKVAREISMQTAQWFGHDYDQELMGLNATPRLTLAQAEGSKA